MFYAAFALLLQVVAVQATLKARAWQSTSFPTSADFPELSDPSVTSKKNVAIGFTGGGSRSYIASMGYLSALNKLGLIPNIRYVVGISGGAWATTVFSYTQNQVDDETFLGPILMPEELSEEILQQMDPKCARSFAAGDFVPIMLRAFEEKKVDTFADAWAYATQEVYLTPAGITPDTPFTWNAASLEDIRSRNPSLDIPFLLPANAERPYPMIGTGLVGPTAGAPYYETRNLTMLEITPLYVGQMMTQDVVYDYSLGVKHTKRVGGVIESFAYGRHGDAPRLGLSSSTKTDILSVPEPTNRLDLQFSAGASSYAPGALVETLPADLPDKLGLHLSYWSPADHFPSSADTLFCDGGSYENILLISLLQRRVEKIVLFINSITPLQPASEWDVYNDPPSKTQVSNDMSAFFGIYPDDLATWEKRSFDIGKNQVFDSADWAPVITTLQAAQARGDGIIGTFNLTTIENTWWGIPAGLTPEITFVYLGRLNQWEKQLSPEMYDLLVPSENADNYAVDVSSGPFRGFPHYVTSAGYLNAERSNVLADMTGWTILKNEALFREVLG